MFIGRSWCVYRVELVCLSGFCYMGGGGIFSASTRHFLTIFRRKKIAINYINYVTKKKKNGVTAFRPIFFPFMRGNGEGKMATPFFPSTLEKIEVCERTARRGLKKI